MKRLRILMVIVVLGLAFPVSPSPASACSLAPLPTGPPLLPIAVPLIVVQQLDDSDKEWEVHDNLDGEFCYTAENGQQYCIEDPGAPHAAQRGWLNLNHSFNSDYLTHDDPFNRTFEQSADASGCPADRNNPPQDKSDLPGLSGYASGDCPYALPIIAGAVDHLDGDFIHGTSGAAEMGVRAVYGGFAGDVFYAPVFDRVYLREEMIGLFGPGAASPVGFPNGGGFSTAGGGGASYYYHIVGFVAVRLGDVQSPHILRGTFVEAVIGPGGIDPTDYTGTGI